MFFQCFWRNVDRWGKTVLLRTANRPKHLNDCNVETAFRNGGYSGSILMFTLTRMKMHAFQFSRRTLRSTDTDVPHGKKSICEVFSFSPRVRACSCISLRLCVCVYMFSLCIYVFCVRACVCIKSLCEWEGGKYCGLNGRFKQWQRDM